MKIKLGAIAYDVKTAVNLTYNGTPVYGVADHDTFTISLEKNIPADVKYLAMWHEVLHCIEAMYGFDFSEQDILVLSMAVAQAVLDNKVLRG